MKLWSHIADADWIFHIAHEVQEIQREYLNALGFFPKSWNSFNINFVLLYVCLIRDYIQCVVQEIPERGMELPSMFMAVGFPCRTSKLWSKWV